MRLEKWGITFWIFVGLVCWHAAILAVLGWNEEGVRTVVRASARASLTLFLLAFSASGLRRLWRTQASAWLLRNRRYLGVSFAVSHALHLMSLIVLGSLFPDRFYRDLNPVVPVAGSIAYLFVAAMAATSFDRSAAWLGPRRWKLLHKTGGYVILAVFAFNFVEMALADPFYLPFALAIVAVLGLRVAGRLRPPRPAQAAAGGARRL